VAATRQFLTWDALKKWIWTCFLLSGRFLVAAPSLLPMMQAYWDFGVGISTLISLPLISSFAGRLLGVTIADELPGSISIPSRVGIDGDECVQGLLKHLSLLPLCAENLTTLRQNLRTAKNMFEFVS
jgi:hypothetical protein